MVQTRTDNGQQVVISDASISYRVQVDIAALRCSTLGEIEKMILHAVCRIAYEHGRDLRACVVLLQFMIDTGSITDAAGATSIAAELFDPVNPRAHPFDDGRVQPTVDVHTQDTAAWRAFQRTRARAANQTADCVEILHTRCGPLVRSALHDPCSELRAIALDTDDLRRLLALDNEFPGRVVPPLRDHLRRRRSRAFHVRRQSALQGTFRGRTVHNEQSSGSAVRARVRRALCVCAHSTDARQC